LAREENSDTNDDTHDEQEEEDKLRTERRNGGASQLGMDTIEVNMVFMIPVEFHAPDA
jgi:hypothetical protein